MSYQERRVLIPVEDERVSGVVTVPQRFVNGVSPALVLAHGAGGSRDDPFLTYLQIFLCGRGFMSVRFNFPYRENNRRAPDREAVLERTVRAVASLVREYAPGHLILGGRSMGGRIASQVLASGLQADGLLLLSYPLHAPGRPDRQRVQHLRRIQAPMLFVSGTRDALAPREALAEAIRGLPTARVSWVEGGDHSLKMLKSSGKTAEDVWRQVSEAAAAWLDDVVANRPPTVGEVPILSPQSLDGPTPSPQPPPRPRTAARTRPSRTPRER